MELERRATVLIAEGDDVVRQTLVEVVRDAGYHVISARDASAADAISSAFVVDVVLLDLSTVRVKRVPPPRRRGLAPPRIVFLSDPDVPYELAEVAFAVLGKSARPASVVEAIAAAVRR